MISRYEAFMDGASLSHISPKILILDVAHEISNIKFTTETIFNRRGSFITGETQEGSVVGITFEIHEYSIQKRQEILQNVIAWANGSVLETNDRPGQQLRCRCVTYPVIASVSAWTDPITMEFKAFEHPFWEQKEPSEITITGAGGTGELFVPGNAGDAFVECTVTPASGNTLTSLTLSAGETSITLTDVTIQEDSPLKVQYDDKGILSIKCGDTSYLSNRTGDDDLVAVCGMVNDFAFTAASSATVVFSVRGMWL